MKLFDVFSPARLSRCGWRQILLGTAGFLATLYALSVLVYVLLVPDIGVRCVFNPVVARLNRHALVGDGDWLERHPYPRVTRVGSEPIEIWPNFLQSLGKLRSTAPAEAVSLADAEQHHLTHVRVGRETFVRVEFQSAPAGGDETPERWAGWFVVGRLSTEELVPSLLWFTLKLGLFLVGALVFWKRPGDDSAAQFFVLCIVTLGAYMGGYHWALIIPCPPLLIGFMVSSVMLPPVLLHFYLLFPRPKPVFRARPRLVLALVYGPPVLFLLGLLGAYAWVYYLVHGASAPAGQVERALDLVRDGIFCYLGIAAVWYLASVISLRHSYLYASDQTERNQVKCILVGSVLAVPCIGWTLRLAVLALTTGDPRFTSGGATWPMFAASVCFTAAFAVSITRYRLMHLDQLISSGVAYFLISSLAGVLYYLVVFVVMMSADLIGSHVVTGPSIPQTVWVSVSVLLLMILLDWARTRLKKALDRRFCKEKYQLDRTLQRMRSAIEQLVDPPTLARRLLQASVDLLGASGGAIYLREGDPPTFRLAGAQGTAVPVAELPPACPLAEAVRERRTLTVEPAGRTPPDGVLSAQQQLRSLGGEIALALAHEGVPLAVLVLGPRPTGHYWEEDLTVLAGFAQITVPALMSAAGHRTIEVLNQELQAKVEKISEQQRRILALQSQLTRRTLPLERDLPDQDGAATAVPDQPPAPAGGVGERSGRFTHIVGGSPGLYQVLQQVRRVAQSPSAVLVRGESGTGKELLAQAVHEASPRAGKPFVKVHCAALPAGLLESELFGHVKGAFTGAHRDKVGRFELAHGGTLFLDEIGDIGLDVQVKLLRVLQEKTFERVGSSEPVQVDVRVIAATHRDLEALIGQNRFREDLFYRLNVLPLKVPALRERREDIPELAAHFLRHYARHLGRDVDQIDDDAMLRLKAYHWPGNIRQLENVVQQAVLQAEGAVITEADLPAELAVDGTAAPTPARTTTAPGGGEAGPFAGLRAGGIRAERVARDQAEKQRLVRALASARGNKAEAARALGLARSTLVSRLKKLGLG